MVFVNGVNLEISFWCGRWGKYEGLKTDESQFLTKEIILINLTKFLKVTDPYLIC